MAKKSTTPSTGLTRSEEAQVLKEHAQKIRQNPAMGIALAKEAGILTKSGRLSSHYKRKDQDNSKA